MKRQKWHWWFVKLVPLVIILIVGIVIIKEVIGLEEEMWVKYIILFLLSVGIILNLRLISITMCNELKDASSIKEVQEKKNG